MHFTGFILALAGLALGGSHSAWNVNSAVQVSLDSAVRYRVAAGQSSDVGLDHVILTTPSLAWGMPEFTRLTGVVPKQGGQHPGLRTENALVSLGSGRYLELLAPVQPRADSAPPRLSPTGWAVHTTELDTLIRRVRAAGIPLLGPMPGSRRTPDSTLLKWRTAAITDSGLEVAPFIIEWSAGTPHPSTTSPGGCQLVSWELVAPDTTRLQTFLRAVGYPANVSLGASPARRLTLDCPKGRVVFSSDRP